MKIHSIKIGKYNVPVSNEILLELVSLLENYAKKHGTTHGFVAFIVESASVRQ